jgi:hypothetical protein
MQSIEHQRSIVIIVREARAKRREKRDNGYKMDVPRRLCVATPP